MVSTFVGCRWVEISAEGKFGILEFLTPAGLWVCPVGRLPYCNWRGLALGHTAYTRDRGNT